MNQKLDLSIVILSYNTKDITEECLKRVKKAVDYCQDKIGNSIEVVVVENASSDGSLKMIRSKHPWVKLVISKVNTGYSAGNNLGMKASRNPLILLLNSDAFVKKDTLIWALNYFKNNPACDLLACKLRLPDHRVQVSTGYLPTPLNTLLWISGVSLLPFIEKFVKPIHPTQRGFLVKEREVEWAMGAFFMMRREVFKQTGGFDEKIFMYGEEVEWCKRITDAGFRMFYVPTFEITHLDKASSKFQLEKPLLDEFKGLKIYFQKHYKFEYLFIRPIIKLFLIMRMVAFFALGNAKRAGVYKNAFFVV